MGYDVKIEAIMNERVNRPNTKEGKFRINLLPATSHVYFGGVVGATPDGRKAQQNPVEYKDLIVRVAGYSDYFIDLTPELQEQIIRRTEHGSY